MSSLFARVVKQALLTFERENYPAFKSNFVMLKQLVDQLTSVDLNIDLETINRTHLQSRDSARTAPVHYIEILEHKTFSMSVFILEKQYAMPLHDHPGYGLLKVIDGRARIQSYSLDVAHEKAAVLRVTEEEPLELASHSECSVLTPTTRNIHEITASEDDSVAFFDILSPPYESQVSIYGPQKCYFYRKMPIRAQSTNSSGRRVFLQHINAPPHYYCDSISYDRPHFLNDPDLFHPKNRQ